MDISCGVRLVHNTTTDILDIRTHSAEPRVVILVTLSVLLSAHDCCNRSMHDIVLGGLDGDLVRLLQCVRCVYNNPFGAGSILT